MLICSVLIAVVKLNYRFLWFFEASEWFCLAGSGRYGLRWEQNPSYTMVTACAALSGRRWFNNGACAPPYCFYAPSGSFCGADWADALPATYMGEGVAGHRNTVGTHGPCVRNRKPPRAGSHDLAPIALICRVMVCVNA